MSVRTEPRDLSQQLQSTLTIPAEQMLAAASTANPAAATALAASPEVQQINEQHLAEANNFNTNSPDHPLQRTVCINIRASLSDLCLKASNSTWAPPSAEANKAIFQQASHLQPDRTAPTAPRPRRQSGAGAGGRKLSSLSHSHSHTRCNPPRRAAHCADRPLSPGWSRAEEVRRPGRLRREPGRPQERRAAQDDPRRPEVHLPGRAWRAHHRRRRLLLRADGRFDWHSNHS